jgi:hypothetical protein
LETLGAQDLLVRGDATRSLSRDLVFTLPVNAHQGGTTWYSLHTHFVVVLDRHSGSGWVYASGSTNGRAVVQDQLRVVRRRGRLKTTWSKVGLIGGNQDGVVSGERIELTDENFAQLAGIKPGRNTLHFQLETYGDARVKSLRVLPDTALKASPIGPGALDLRVSATPGPRLEVGELLTITARLVNKGGLPVRNVILSLSYQPSSFRLVRGHREKIAVIGKEPVTRVFVVRALSLGPQKLSLGVDSVNSSPSAVLTPTVVKPSSTNWVLWGSIGAVAVGLGLAGVGRHRLVRSRIGRRE